MTTFTTIPDTDINPDKPIKSETAYALRDNPLAIAEGDASAPPINPAALFIGGKGGDGVLDNAATLSGIGYFDFSSMNVTANKTLPSMAIIRIAGNATLSATLRSVRSLNTTTNAQEALDAADLFGAYVTPTAGTISASSGRGGDGVCGTGGTTVAHGTIRTPTATSRFWARQRPLIGGNGGLTSGGSAGSEWGPGGGGLIIIIDGDLNCTGGTIDVSGADTNDVGAGGNAPGAGGGGLLLVICTGAITAGTYKANGGSDNGAVVCAAGGGGFVQLIASNYIGTQTMQTNGGTGWGGNSNYNGTAGQSNKLTLTRDQIRTMLQRY